MLCEVTNNLARAHVLYNSKRRPVNIEPKQTVKIDMTLGDYEFAHERALVGVGPQIEIIEPDEAQSRDEPTQSEVIEPKVGIGRVYPTEEIERAAVQRKPRRKYKRRKQRRVVRRRQTVEQENSDGERSL